MMTSDDELSEKNKNIKKKKKKKIEMDRIYKIILCLKLQLKYMLKTVFIQ